MVSATRTERPRRGIAPGLLALVPGVFVLVGGWSRRWSTDDAFIDFRVVANLLAGHGPVFNPGERVEAFSNPLWVGLLTLAAAPARWLRMPHGSIEGAALVLGLAGAVLGVVAAGLACARRAGADDAGALPWPLGTAMLAAFPPLWDFSTSGLETGLGMAWLGTTYAALVRHVMEGSTKRRAVGVAVLVGVGPLVRPDFGLFALGYFLLLLLGGGRPRAGDVVRWMLAAAALPLAYQVFRMGYFASVVPNTAIAKEATVAHWRRGLAYFLDFAVPYHLWAPAVAVLAGAALEVTSAVPSRRGRVGALLLVPVGCGLVHALYVVRAGGDFMHARLLLPAFFAVVMPLALTPTRPVAFGWIAVVTVAWSLACGAGLCSPARAALTPGVVDERAFYTAAARRAHPVTAGDYRAAIGARDGHALAVLSRGRRLLLLGPVSPVQAPPGSPLLPVVDLTSAVPASLVAARQEIGLCGFVAGSRVHVVDRHGLADPLAARLALDGAREGRAGHEKRLPMAWLVARFAAPGARLPTRSGGSTARIDAAREALACGDLAELARALGDPLTPARFARNIARAWRLTWLRIPADAFAARDRLCGRGGGARGHARRGP